MNGRVSSAAAAAVVACSFVIGYLTSSFDIMRLAMLVVVLAMAWFVFKWPHWGLVLLLSLTSTVVVPEQFSLFAAPNTIYYGIELLLIFIITASFLTGSKTNTLDKQDVFQRIYASPISIAITVFLFIAAIKIALVLIEKRLGGGSLGQMFSFNRGLSFYLLFFPVLLILNTVSRQKWMVKVIYTLGIVIIFRVLLELLFPSWWGFQWMSIAIPLVEDSPNVDVAVLRLRTPGDNIVLLCFWMGLMNLITRSWSIRRLAYYVPLTLVMLVGMLLEFNRSYIIPMMLLAVLALLLNQKLVRLKLVVAFVITMCGLMLFFAATGNLNEYYDAAKLRYGTAFSSQTRETQSIVSRDIEQQYAWQAIRRSPLLGIGLDELYRPPVPGMMDNLRYYIHNSYIWVWTYYGIVGLGAFLAILFLALFRNMTNWKRVKEPILRAALLGNAFTLATLLGANIAAPKFYDLTAAPVVALMIGMSEAIIIRSRKQSDAG